MPSVTSSNVAYFFGGAAVSAVVFYILHYRRRTEYDSKCLIMGKPRKSYQEACQELEYMFRVSTDKLAAVLKALQLEMVKGLLANNQTLKMIPSYVTKLPLGNERGTFLALDLGGTNFRVCEVVLEGKGRYRMRQKKYTVSEAIKTGPGSGLFDFIADCVGSFIADMNITTDYSNPISLGFTFSFPINQTEINRGTLVQWNKGFTCEGVVGKDVVSLLQASLKKKKINVSVDALVNDTVGTLVAHAYSEPDETFLGVILGTGTNAAYVESMTNIKKWQKNDEINDPCMIINTEWGAFDKDRLILPSTKYDVQLDRESLFPGMQLFEKMISGMYLGELVRLVIQDLNAQGVIFGNERVSLEKDSFETVFMSRIERDHSRDLADTRSVLEELLKIPKTTLNDRQMVKKICELVAIRASRLSAAAIGAIIQKIRRLEGCNVAIDGSLFEHYPHFQNRMYDALRELFSISADNIRLSLARDGSGVGAALIAMLSKQQQPT